jgi:hypothetical protein
VHFKVQLVTILQKLIALDQVQRFYYGSARENPYVLEAAKYGQIFAEILGHAVERLTTRKAERRPAETPVYTMLATLEKGCLKDEDSWLEGDHEAPAVTTDHPELGSQNFLSDFVDFLNNLVRVRIRSLNQAILPQVVGHLVRIVAVRYDAAA